MDGASLDSEQFSKAGLQIHRDDNPPGHANVFGWPEAVEDRKDKMQELASIARAYKLSNPAENCSDCSQCD